MPTLHVAAMPFPSVQGTQAAVRAMVEAEHRAGRGPELLTYAHGSHVEEPAWPHHRIRDLVRDRSLRSGPSLRKLVEDAQLAVAARQHFARMEPTAVIAHHVEATAACLAARLTPTLFVAHTALEPELPTYLPATVSQLAERAGGALDVALASRAGRVAAVSPWLQRYFEERADRRVAYVPVPWSVPEPFDAAERARARRRFDLEPTVPVVLYTGNLDRYQGLDVLVRGFARLRERRPKARLLIATASSVESLEQRLWSAGHARAAIFAPLGDEPDRRVAHAAADVAWVPRHSPGGLPMKLLDAMARGLPTVASRAAAAGLDLERGAMVTADRDPEALAAASLLVFDGREGARDLAARGVAFVRTAHSEARFLDALDSALA